MQNTLNIGKDDMIKELRRKNVETMQLMQDKQDNFNAKRDVEETKSI